MTSVGVVGHGFVGRAVVAGFQSHFDVSIYDIKDPGCSKEQTLSADIVFICVPTPTVHGGQDQSAVVDVLDSAAELKTSSVYVLKSTIHPGTTERFRTWHPQLRLVHNPEFLSSRTAIEDFKNQKYTILGGYGTDITRVSEIYKVAFPGIDVRRTTPTVSETVKYLANNFYAVKISFMNEFYRICQELSIPFDEVRDLALLQGWINPMHTKVPGPDGKLGFGNHCLPKDLNAMIEFAEQLGTRPNTMRAAAQTNLQLRENPIQGD